MPVPPITPIFRTCNATTPFDYIGGKVSIVATTAEPEWRDYVVATKDRQD
jgi:hypothetical protein